MNRRGRGDQGDALGWMDKAQVHGTMTDVQCVGLLTRNLTENGMNLQRSLRFVVLNRLTIRCLV